MLAEGDTGNILVTLHFAHQALRLAAQATLYTNGDEALAQQLSDALEATLATMTIDAGKIKRLVKGPERAQVVLQFEDGTSRTEAFPAHEPKTRLRGSLLERLGLELTPVGPTIKVGPLFNQTGFRGGFAAGDCASPMQTVTPALHLGTCIGVGAPLQIRAEALEQKAIF